MIRTLSLDDEPRLGEMVADGFRSHWEWWLQMSRFVSGIGTKKLVTAEEAIRLADSLEARLDQIGLQVHLYFWGDDDQVATRGFITFLRGGGFHVVDERQR